MNHKKIKKIKGEKKHTSSIVTLGPNFLKDSGPINNIRRREEEERDSPSISCAKQ